MERLPMTPEGFARLKAKLAELEALMPEISKEIGIAADHGDLKENAEYHAAREKQGFTKSQIDNISSALARSEVIDPKTLSGERIKFGATVELEDIDSGKVQVYKLVGPDEAEIARGTISITSPVAKALIGREVGDEVKVKVPGGLRTYEVSSVDWK